MAQWRSPSLPVFDLRGGSGGGDRYQLRPSPAGRYRSRVGKRRKPPAAAAAAAVAVVVVVSFLFFFSTNRVPPRVSDADGEDETEARFKKVQFGSGGGASSIRDSRYWDRDDRRRDEDYGENESVKNTGGSVKDLKSHERADKLPGFNSQDGGVDIVDDGQKSVNRKGVLYNEGGRKELVSYGAEYEASLLNATSDALKDIDPEDEYDDGIDAHDYFENVLGGDVLSHKVSSNDSSGAEIGVGSTKEKLPSEIGKEDIHRNDGEKVLGSEKKSGTKKKSKKKRAASSVCEMKFRNSTVQLVEPMPNKKFAQFLLEFTEAEERPVELNDWEPRFAGHQTLQEREESFLAKDQRINCGFVNGPGGSSTGFDISDEDWRYMSNCHIAVSSCIFGNSDRLRSPFGKTVSSMSKKNVCFSMFLDEVTLQTLLSEGQTMDNMGFIGLWKIVVVRNLPYQDMRRVGKIPKFLAHRLFPNARFSLWLDSKLRLQKDPLLVIEYFLWRHGHEYAISNHYDRHCVWEEVAQNKKLNKYNHTVIDQQFEFYQRDGLKKFDPLDANKLIPSYVPEGSFIVREHTPMSNLFSCLWYNEVERFTPRDQLSFAYTFLKLSRMNPGKRFYLNMFKDCERRSIAKLFHHRADEKQSATYSLPMR